MTYRELLLQAELKLEYGDITLGEFEQMIAPLNREVDVLCKIRAEIERRKKNSGGEPNRDLAFNVCLQIIDRYKERSE